MSKRQYLTKAVKKAIIFTGLAFMFVVYMSNNGPERIPTPVSIPQQMLTEANCEHTEGQIPSTALVAIDNVPTWVSFDEAFDKANDFHIYAVCD